jgi:hypothetical protein
MIIANINLSVSVENAAEAARAAEAVADRYGGFVASSNVRDGDKGQEAAITVRVPHARLTDALRDLRAVGTKVTEETRSTQDVTEEFTDVESNIRNLRTTEAQLIALIERANRIEDVMSIQRELTNIRGQIERLEGRRRVLENRAELATIAMRLIEPVSLTPRNGWNPLETTEQALIALGRFAQALTTLLIWGVVFSPFSIIPALVIRWFLRNREARPTAPQIP